MILAPNHFSQMDHFFAGVYLRRKIRFMAKSQLFGRTRSSPTSTGIGGVFPVRRGHHDEEAFKTAHAILDRGGCVLIYAEGGRSRTGELGEPKPGVGRIALESGVPVVPVAIHGSHGVRGWKRLALPQGHGPVRRAAHLPARRGARPASSSSRRRGEIFDRVKAMYAALEEQRPRERDQVAARGRGPAEPPGPARPSAQRPTARSAAYS